jgi:hypothetical protein
MSTPLPPARSIDSEIIRAQTETTRIRAEAGKAIVATVFRGLVPLGVFGIAIGATAIIIERAAPSLHLVGLLIVWIAATVVSACTVLASALETQRVSLRRLLGGQQSTQLEVNEAKKLLHSIQE